MNIWGLLTIVLFSLAWFPQIQKTWKTKSVEDLSLSSFILLPLAAGICGSIYTYQVKDWTLLAGYLLGIMCTCVLAGMYIRYKR